MKNMGGLSVGIVLLGLAAVGGGAGLAQSAVAATPVTASGALAQAKVFAFDQMTARPTPNGGESRNIVQGVLATGEAVGLHESMLPVGRSPNPGHVIQHSEFIVVREGTLQFEHDGRQERVGPGGVIYVAFGTMHKITNVGTVPAQYVVIAIGGDTKK